MCESRGSTELAGLLHYLREDDISVLIRTLTSDFPRIEQTAAKRHKIVVAQMYGPPRECKGKVSDEGKSA